MSNRIWVDVEDLFEYARANARPSGIQRLAFEICRALVASEGDRVRFVRHAGAAASFRIVPWAVVAAMFETLTAAEAPGSTLPDLIEPHGAARQSLRKLVYRLPPALRVAVVEAAQASAQAAAAWARVPRTAAAARRRTEERVAPADGGDPDIGFDASTAGDVLLAPGAPWGHPDYAALIAAQRARGIRFALLVYDIIPLRRPEWCQPGLVRIFRTWLPAILPQCDRVFAISQATAADVRAYAARHAVALQGPVTPIPIGTGWTQAASPGSKRPDLPEPGTYALIVSTIEVRKNHVLLFRIWRRLLEELPPERVPTLVFAGRVGWLTGDLVQQIVNAEYLDGKIVVLQNPSDADLAALYCGCLFTLFPSLYEGWGLPVTESLAFGKPCLISNLTSLPEAGGDLARSFDPDNLNEAYGKIREAIEDRTGLAAWEATIREDFVPVPWSATAQALIDAL
ncbi:MAG TPA: glycosyltransferase family 1 protein [Acetobacteraceae bacterium]|nr:glycosyltransferase family 1 protein [Acetobacteraceae bacterium]